MKKFKYWLFSLLLFPSVTLAQSIPIPDNPGLPDPGGNDIGAIIGNIITDIILPVVGIICVLFIIIGGFRYITSAGNDEAAAAGKKTVTNAIIGLVIVILSYAIIVVIANTTTLL